MYIVYKILENIYKLLKESDKNIKHYSKVL